MREVKFQGLRKGTWYTLDFTNSQRWARGLLELIVDGQATFEFETPLRQYTGLHDKQGKEIYEGDIIKGTRLDYFMRPDENQEVVVVYSEGGFYPFADNNDYAPYPKPEEVEVIGNIYENPELLEEVK